MLVMEQGSTANSPEELVARIHAGDRDAEQELVSIYWRALYFILNRRAEDPELAADITQETFIVVINKARQGGISNPSAISAFIRQVGINLLIGNYRKEARQKTDLHDDIQVNVPDNMYSIQESVDSEQLAKLVKQIIEELPTKRDKDILYRYFVYGQSKQVLCREFELTPAHFDRVLHRARQRLKQLLEVKLGIDLRVTSLSSLLSIVFLGFCALGEIEQIDSSPKSFAIEMRGNEPSLHLLNTGVKERLCDELECEAFQRNRRWS
jgi:RNA polymerase sigma-70 factor (ECF subfamily)